MTNRMITVQENINTTNDLIKSEYTKLLTKLEDILNELIVEPHGATIIQRDIRMGLWNETEIHFQIGFYNEADQRVDFASDAWFEYNTKKNELLVNYGTIGNYTKSNVYQVRRVKMISDIFDNIDTIEATLAAFVQDADNGQWRQLITKKYEYEEELSQLKKEARAQQLVEVEQNLREGDVVYYRPDVRLITQLFPSWNSAKATITRICQKTIKIKMESGRVYQLPKDKFCAHIADALLVVQSED